ncbi:MAG: HD domain-containing phosphohydrolase [Polyangiaceae bacterium]
MTAGPNLRVLCVDDEPLVLQGLERTLFGRFEVTTESSSVAALTLLESEPPFAVILSDMRMPVMDGATLLAKARELSPFTSRLLLTGHSEVEAAAAAVNQGQILRFLTKPSQPAVLIAAIEAGVEQHRLVTAERELLEQTLTGSVRLLTEVLSLFAPGLFSRTQRIRALVAHMAKRSNLNDPWRFEVASLLCMVGCVGLPDATLERILARSPLAAADQRAFDEHPESAYRLLSGIPRFGEVAEMIKLQGPGPHADPTTDVERGGALLRIAIATDHSLESGRSMADAIAEVGRKLSVGELSLLNTLSDFRAALASSAIRTLKVAQMTAQMQLEEDVRTKAGVVVVPKGRELSMVLLERLCKFSNAGTLVEPIRVRVPG